MTRLLMAACLLAGCGSKSKPAATPDPAPTTTETPTETSPTEAGKVCDLDTPDSCPEGQTCTVPEGSPTRSGTCQ